MKRHGGNERTSGREEATRSVIPTARRSGDGDTAETASRAAVARGGAGCVGGRGIDSEAPPYDRGHVSSDICPDPRTVQPPGSGQCL